MNVLAEASCDVIAIEAAAAKANAAAEAAAAKANAAAEAAAAKAKPAKPAAKAKPAKPAAKAKPAKPAAKARDKGKAIQKIVPEWDDTSKLLLEKAVKKHGKSYQSFKNIMDDHKFKALHPFGSGACRLKWKRMEDEAMKEKLMKDAQPKVTERKRDGPVTRKKGEQLKGDEVDKVKVIKKKGPEELDSESDSESDSELKWKHMEEKAMKEKLMKDAQPKVTERKRDGPVTRKKGEQLKGDEVDKVKVIKKKGPKELDSEGVSLPVHGYLRLMLKAVTTVVGELKDNNAAIKETNSTLKELVTLMKKP